MMILTSGHHLQASGCPLSSKDPPKEMEDMGSLDGGDDHFRQRQTLFLMMIFYVHHLQVSGCPLFSKVPPTDGAVLTGRPTVFGVLTFSFKYVFEDSALGSEHHAMAGKGLILAVDDHICQLRVNSPIEGVLQSINS